MKALGTILGILILGGGYPVLVAAEQPSDWLLAGKDPSSYEMVTDGRVVHGGKSSARLASTKEPGGFGTMLQSFDPREYLGKRLRLSAFVKSEGVDGWAGVWMRIDGPLQGKSLAFDNMQDRPLQGTLDWKRYDVVLDVSEEATNIGFGVLLDGQGKVWVDDLTFEIVSSSVPTTNQIKVNSVPQNLDFEH